MGILEENEKIIVWGIGKVGTEFIKKYEKIYKIWFLVDNRVATSEDIGGRYKVYNPQKLKEEKYENIKIVIAIRNWKDTIAQLKDLGKDIFKDYIPVQYLDYDMMDIGFLCALEDDSKKRYYINLLAQGKKIVIPYGMCHMMAYKRILSKSKQFSQEHILVDFPAVNNINHINYDLLREKVIWEESNIILCSNIPFLQEYNVYNLKEFSSFLKTDCRIITVTNAAFKGYFPQHMENKNCGYEIRFRFGWGDKNINKMIKQGKSVEEIADAILNPNFYAKEMVEKYIEHAISLMKEEEKECVVKIADYVEENYKKELLYYSWTHPAVAVVTEIIRRILYQFSITDIQIEEYIANEEEYFKMDANEELLYPSVAKAVNLEHICNARKLNPGHYYKAEKKLTSKEYIERYIENMKGIIENIK